MEEQLLQFIWHRRLFETHSLRTTSGAGIEVIDTGTPNADQGPDFLFARIRIGRQLWIGHVEIHVRSSSWYLHAHDRDPHYNNIILHVVWTEDMPVRTADGYQPPCLELGARINHQLLDRFRALMQSEAWVPCADVAAGVPSLVRTAWLARLMAERLEGKSGAILQILARNRTDWEQTFFVMLARHLGAPTNADPMEALAHRIPLTLLRRHGDRPDQAEALLFGASGMLNAGMEHPYLSALSREFRFLRMKYGIKPLEGLQWRFLRMRPAHFPTLRVAQLASMVRRTERFMDLVEQRTPESVWLELFQTGPVHPFWTDHYHFAAASPPSRKAVGRTTAISLLLNVVVPMAFLYGKHQGDTRLKDYAVSLWQALPPERNAVITGWKRCGWPARDAAESQALLHLRRTYCVPRRCLHCAVGLHLMKTGLP